ALAMPQVLQNELPLQGLDLESPTFFPSLCEALPFLSAVQGAGEALNIRLGPDLPPCRNGEPGSSLKKLCWWGSAHASRFNPRLRLAGIVYVCSSRPIHKCFPRGSHH